MPRPNRFVLALLLSLSLTAIQAVSQTEDASISGRITDPTGAVVPDVTVSLQSAERGTIQQSKTNSAGIYLFPAVHPGVYHVTVRKPGFGQIDFVGLTANVQAHIEQNFQLKLGATSESVTVQAESVGVNTTDASVSTVVDRQFVENTPLNGRSFQDLIALAPGTTLVGGPYAGTGYSGEFSVNGQRTESNYFTVDGVSANTGTAPGYFGGGAGFAGATGSETVTGTTQSMVSIDALQEFRASTSTYSAEYGRTPGGQFALTTRAGTNAWHGSLYDYFRNDALDASNWFVDELGLPKVEERQNDFGGTLGGPIRLPHVYDGKDKTFFFFSYEGVRLRSPQGVSTSLVPDQALRDASPVALQPILNAFPIPQAEDGQQDGLGLYSAAYSLPSNSDSVSVRVDHSLNKKTTLFGRYANTPSTASFYMAAFREDSEINTRLITLGATSSVNPNQTNEFRFNATETGSNYLSVSTNLGGATPFNTSSLPGPNGGPFPQDGGTIGICFCFGDYAYYHFAGSLDNSQRQYNLTDSYTVVIKRHQIHFGFDWRRLSTETQPIRLFESATFSDEPSIINNQPSGVTAQATGFTPAEPIYNNFSSYIEDNWKTTPRLSLSLGLRWEVVPAPSNGKGTDPYTVDQITNLATIQLAPAGTPLWKTDWHAFAPRVGANYVLRNTPGRELVVRGGFGVFFDMGNANGSAGLGAIGFGSLISYPNAGNPNPSFPLTSAQVDLPPPQIGAPYSTYIEGFDPHLKLPRTLQWNVALEKAFDGNDVLTASYVASAGQRLLAMFNYAPENAGNPNFNANACAACLYITKNAGSSNYNSLQLQFQRKISHGLQALASYTWSHSEDNASSNYLLTGLVHGNSDFDLRHNFQTALTYEPSLHYSQPLISALLSHWALDTRLALQSAFPIDLIGSQSYDPITTAFLDYHPNVVPCEPVYLRGSQYPGGKVINFNAFAPAPAGVDGDSGRNSVRGFGLTQVNLALRRDFFLGERVHLQFRAEAFNVLNHPNFGSSSIDNFLGDGACTQPPAGQPWYCFGVASATLNQSLGGLDSLYQTGGPRSLQIALKLKF